MDYIFKEWEDKLKAMADSVEKDLKEIITINWLVPEI